MKCLKCRADCTGGGNFCSNCGARITKENDLKEDTIFKNNIFSLQRQRGDDINLVLLGRSGVGKSTWVNSFVNFLKHNSFEHALNGPVYVPIYSQFHHADQDSTAEEIKQRLVTISLGENENLCEEYAGGNVSASATAMPMCHRVEPKDGSYCINLIDTPGVRATSKKDAEDDWRNVEQVDKQNLDTILYHISQYKYINAFIIFLKPDEEKLDQSFTYSLQKLFSQLHESAKSNVIFAFTHANYCNFDDTKPVLVLDNYLQQIGLDIKITRSNVFYFDSTPFRYLATRSKNYRPKEDPYSVESCWKKSVQSCQDLINYVDKLPPHNTYSTVSIYSAKCMILLVLKPLVKICGVNEENIAELKNAFEHQAFKSGRKILPNIREKVLTYKKLEKPMTVCTNQACCKKENVLVDGSYIFKSIYDPICCKDCKTPFISDEVPGNFFIHFCHAMRLGKCKVCKHHTREHMHVTYELSEAEKLFEIETKDINTRVKQLELELKIIIDTLAFFSKYLEKFALMSDKGDPVKKYIDEEIRKSNELMGVAQQHKSFVDKAIKEQKFVNYELEIQIKQGEETLKGIQKRLEDYNTMKGLRKEKNLDPFDFLDHSEMPNQLKMMEEELKTHFLNENFSSETEYEASLIAKEESAQKFLNDKKKECGNLAKLDAINNTIVDLENLLIGLEKINRMYNDKLKQSNADANPIKVKEMIGNLCKLKHNGQTFANIYVDILRERKKHTTIDPKILNLESGYIPTQLVPDSKRPIERE